MTSPEPESQPGTDVVKVDEAEESKHRLLKLAETPEERAFAFNAMTAVRQSRLIRQAAESIAATSWGKEISPVARAAVARYAYECGTDPVRHWTVLGGNLYDTSTLWLELATSQPTYEGYDVEHINDDKRLDEQERAHRRQLRATYNMPDDVKGCAIVTIFKRMPGGEVRTFKGVNHAGNRKGFVARKGADGEIRDPIGEQDPGKTAETRAFRRAAKRAWPIWRFKRDIPDDEGLNVAELGRQQIGEMLTHEQAEAKRLQTGNPKLDGVKRFMDVAGADGLKIADTTGDRVSPPVNPYQHPDHEQIETIEGVGTPGGDPYNLNGDILLICECGNWDSVSAGDSIEPECSGGCGRRMRPATASEMDERQHSTT